MPTQPDATRASKIRDLIATWLSRNILFRAFVVAFLLTSCDLAAAEQDSGAGHWNTDWTFEQIDVGSLVSRLRKIGITIPVSVEGKVSVNLQVGVPLRRLRDGKAYRFDGTLTSKRLRIEGLQLRDARFEVAYRDGYLSLKRMSANLAPEVAPEVASAKAESVKAARADGSPSRSAGRLTGNAKAQLLPLGDFNSDLQVEGLSLSAISRLWQDATAASEDASDTLASRPLGGEINGRLNAQAPIAKVTQPDVWKLNADVSIDRFTIGRSAPIRIESGQVSLRKGILSVKQMRIADKSSASSLGGEGQIELLGQRRFRFAVRGNDLSLHAITHSLSLGEWLHGKLDLIAQGSGSLSDANFDINGKIASPSLRIAGLDLGLLEHRFSIDPSHVRLVSVDPLEARGRDDCLIGSFNSQYSVTPDAIMIHQMVATAFDGELSGSALLSRLPDGEHRLDGSCRDFHLRWARASSGPLRQVSGTVAGRLSLTVPASKPAEAVGQFHLDVADVQVDQSTFGRLALGITVKNGIADISGDGRCWDGKLELSGTAVIDPSKDQGARVEGRENATRSDAVKLTLSLKSARVNPWLRTLRQTRLHTVSGNLTAQATVRLPDWSDAPQGEAEIRISNLSSQGRSLSPRLQVRIQGDEKAIRFRSIDGGIAGGQLNGTGIWSFRSNDRHVRLGISHADMTRFTDAIAPELPPKISGKASTNVTLQVGANGDLRLSGPLSVRNMFVGSVPAGQWDGYLHAKLSGDLTRWTVSMPSLRGNLAHGRVAADIRLKSSSTRPGSPDLSSRWVADRIDFGELLGKASPSLSTYAHGRVSGDLTLSAKGLRHARDLSGHFDARLEDTQSSAIPGLVSADRFLGVISLASTRFERGKVSGFIGGGAATIDEFWMRSNRVRVWAEGRIRLEGDMDLNVIVATGNFAIDNQLVALAAQLAVQSVLPITGLMEINRLLSNRTIHLSFTGPTTNPRVQLLPLAIIREEAARFLIREILVAGSITSD